MAEAMIEFQNVTKRYQGGQPAVDALTMSIDKGAITVASHPDKVVPYAMEAIRAVAAELGAALTTGEKAPVMMRVEFAVRVDSNAVVQIARNVEAGQFKVTLQWDT